MLESAVRCRLFFIGYTNLLVNRFYSTSRIDSDRDDRRQRNSTCLGSRSGSRVVRTWRSPPRQAPVPFLVPVPPFFAHESCPGKARNGRGGAVATYSPLQSTLKSFNCRCCASSCPLFPNPSCGGTIQESPSTPLCAVSGA